MRGKRFMCHGLLVGSLGALQAPLALAADSSSAASAAAEPSAASLARAKQKLGWNQAQVLKLQQDVSRQEAVSKASAAKLQQQDASIAELQRQLQALRTTSTSAGH